MSKQLFYFVIEYIGCVFSALKFACVLFGFAYREAWAGNAEELADWVVQYIRTKAATEEVEMAAYGIDIYLN